MNAADSRKAQLTPQRGDHPPNFHKRSTSDDRKRSYREQGDDTPSHGGGVNTSAKSAIHDRHHKNRRVDISSKDQPRNDYGNSYDYPRRGASGRPDYRDRPSREHRDRPRNRDSNRPRGDDGARPPQRYHDRPERGARDNNNSSRRRDEPHSERSFRPSSSSRRGGGDSVRFADEPLTPAFSIANTPSRKAWDEEDSALGSSRRSGSTTQWDYPSPQVGGSRREDETPLPTPAHKFNPWIKQPGSSRLMETPWFVKNKDNTVEGETEEVHVDRDEWEDEQKRLDREWYQMDEGYDEVHNPFAGVSEEYTKKKEDQIAQKKSQRMSAQQRQIHRDNELWEKNRMLTSGVVVRVEDDDEDDDVGEARVHLLVHHIIPPFLDGRIVFTKQFEPVVPVRVLPTNL